MNMGMKDKKDDNFNPANAKRRRTGLDKGSTDC
ncbi:hypothetical protein FHS47_001722 [Lutibacter sp. SG786]|nr:hypothetical protein [Luteibacter sp. SG786]